MKYFVECCGCDYRNGKTKGVSVKESRGQPKSDALKQVTCKGNF